MHYGMKEASFVDEFVVAADQMVETSEGSLQCIRGELLGGRSYVVTAASTNAIGKSDNSDLSKACTTMQSSIPDQIPEVRISW